MTQFKKLLVLISIISFFAGSNAFARDYVNGDGSLDLICTNKDSKETPQNYFDLTFMYDQDSGKTGFDLISDENLASGNGDLVYQMKLTQFPFFGAEIMPVVQNVPGCEFAQLIMTSLSETEKEIYFECDADGDAGYGSLTMDLETGFTEGAIFFPEGQSTLIYPFEEDTKIDVVCSYK